ncbi:MAG: hypothetical protein PHV34_11820, partial [Verrucomicrobiae bacterium]|nr:hypothetical protein [Verrucomicrobiae bacterium]
QVIDKRMSKKQQMRWTPFGAHQLLQVRTKVLNDEWEATFRSWCTLNSIRNSKRRPDFAPGILCSPLVKIIENEYN